MSDANKPTRATTCGYCKSRVPKGHECAAKAEAMKERTCLLETCGVVFKPTVYGQRYCCKKHKRQSRCQREFPSKRKWPAKGFRAELNTIAPLERVWERAAMKAAQYAPVMGEALVEITRSLMRAA